MKCASKMPNWQGQRLAYISLEGEPQANRSKSDRKELFDARGPALASLGLTLDKNVVRTRVYGRTRDARNIVSAVRGRAFSGQGRAATSSFISPDHLDWYSDVALELWAMAAPTEGAPRKVAEIDAVAVVRPASRSGVAGLSRGHRERQVPDPHEQYAEILPRAARVSRRTAATGITWCASRSCFTRAKSRSRCSTLPQRSRRCRSKMPRSSRSRAIQRPASSSRSR